MRRNIRRNGENTAGSCVGVSIKHQTAGSPLGQHIAGCLFTSLPSHLLSLPASANRHINVPSSRLHPLPICLPPDARRSYHFASVWTFFFFYLGSPRAASLEINAHLMMSALVACIHAGRDTSDGDIVTWPRLTFH